MCWGGPPPERVRHFECGVLIGTDAYWADMSGGVDAWVHYRVGQGRAESPSIFTTGSRAGHRRRELLNRTKGRAYNASGESFGRRVGATRRYQSPQAYALLVQERHPGTGVFQGVVLYIKEVVAPVFGPRRYWCCSSPLESARPRFRLFPIVADKQPRRLLHEVEGGVMVGMGRWWAVEGVEGSRRRARDVGTSTPFFSDASC